MGQDRQQTVLFLCTGNYYRSRFAEILFNSVAARMGLPWRAASRGLALERGVDNVGPMAPSAVEALSALGIPAAAASTRMPIQVTLADLQNAGIVIALKQDEHLPLLQERFPAHAEQVEFWHVADAPEALAQIEQQVTQLIARLFGGVTRPASAEGKIATDQPGLKEQAARGAVVKVGRETKGRRGKGVTTVWEVPLDEDGVRELAARLKDRCGTGGTVKDGRIEIQGDQRDRVAAELEKLGYKVKRIGG